MFQVKDINVKDWKSYKYMVVKPQKDGFHYYMVCSNFTTADRVSKRISGLLMTTSEVEAI